MTEKQIVEAMFAIEEKQKKKMKEAEKSESSSDKKDYKGMFQYAHFICVSSGAVIPRDDLGAIQQHKERCDYCIAAREQREKEKADRLEGYQRIRFALHEILQTTINIEWAYAKLGKKREPRYRPTACKIHSVRN